MSSTLMKWPVELRLVLYSHLITSCLRDGKAFDIAGVLMCCRPIYDEIRNEHMNSIAPLLRAKYKWETCPFTSLASLSISLQTSLRRSPQNKKLHIALALHATPDDSLVSSGLDHFVPALQPVLTSHWSEVTLGFGGPTTETPNLRWHQHKLHGLVERLDPSVFAAPRMQRLVLDFRNAHGIVNSKDYMFMLNIPNLARQMQFETGRTRRSVQRMWISRVTSGPHQGWRVSIDFVSHLEAVEGGLWRLQDDDAGVLRITRLPGNMKEALDPVWLEEQFSPRLSKWAR